MKKVLIYISVMCFCLLLIPMLIVSLGADAGSFRKPGATPPETTQLGVASSSPERSAEIPRETAEPLQTDDGGDYLINVYHTATKKILRVSLEDYIVSVVLAEMPARFELEALKAQAVAARTYTYRKMLGAVDQDHKGAVVCTDSTHCQAWRALEEIVDSTPDRNGEGAMKAADKITKVKKAVAETRGMIAIYNNEPIEALYHSCSGGMTENAENVWDGGSRPYLKAVKSQGEESADTKFQTTVTVGKTEFIKKLKESQKEFSATEDTVYKSISSIKRSPAGRILSMKIGGVIFSGKDLRKVFGLNSANVVLKEDGNNIRMITLGFGHGVGLSQYGADARAKEGLKYDEILKYYYTGIDLKKI